MVITYTTDLFRRNWPDHYQRSRPLTVCIEHYNLLAFALLESNIQQNAPRYLRVGVPTLFSVCGCEFAWGKTLVRGRSKFRQIGLRRELFRQVIATTEG